MYYRRDKNSKFKKIFLGVILIVLAYFLFEKTSFRQYSSKVFVGISSPIWRAEDVVSGKFSDIALYFSSKKSLKEENEWLKQKISEEEVKLLDYSRLQFENLELKEVYSRSENKRLVLGGIISKPGKTIYDTLIIDAGIKNGVKNGDIVLAYGNVIIGEVGEATEHYSKVKLYSSPGEKFEGVLSGNNVFAEVFGRGGGNFEINVPRDLVVNIGEQVQSKGVNPFILGTVEDVVADPRDPLKKVLLKAPANVNELKWVFVLK